MNLDFKNFVKYIRDTLNNTTSGWEKAEFHISFSIGDDEGHGFRYYNQGIEYEKVLSIFEYVDILDESLEPILNKKKIRDFNKVILTITKEDFSVEYQMDEEKVIKEKQESALLFPNYLYERMRTLIYEYEIANNLLTPIYDEYGLDGYEESWDTGLFTFMVDATNKTIQYTIELSFNDVKRIVPMPLETYFKDAIFHHHELTHGELKEFWQPWNKIVLTAPEQFIPLGKDQEYIEYSLVDIINV